MRWLLLAAMLSLLPLSGNALECRGIEGATPALAAIDARTRLAFLVESSQRAADKAKWWTMSWTLLYGTLTAVQLGLVAPSSGGDRIDLYFGAASAFVGVLFADLAPLPVMSDAAWLERRIARAPPETHVCALLADAERLLLRDAAAEAFGRSPLMHVATLGFNIALGLALGIIFDRWEGAVLTIFPGVAIGELMIVTQPVESVRTLVRYRAGDLTRLRKAMRAGWSIAPSLGRSAAGLALRWSF